MTAPIVHALTTTFAVTGYENFDIKAHTRAWIGKELLHEAPCLEGREEAVTVTLGPDPAFSDLGVYRAYAKAPCPTPDTCSLLRKADR